MPKFYTFNNAVEEDVSEWFLGRISSENFLHGGE